jgi:UDP-N-acetylmuramate--alanine ligase
MDLNQVKRVFFIGIGGIGMSAIARFCKENKMAVTGYDLTSTDLTKQLQLEHIEVIHEDDISKLDKLAELVVYTPAIPANNQMLNWYRENNYPVYKRSDVLQWITEKMFAITIAGTHGKTTVSTMVSYLIREAGSGCNAFLGGISNNYNTNYWGSDNDVVVVEADEYDRSFLKLSPNIAVLTAMDADHLDIYGTEEEVEKAFIAYTQNIKPGGTLIFKHGIKHADELKADNVISYSLQNEAADIYASNIVQKNGGYIFDIHGSLGLIQGIHLPIGGMHNVENAVVAIAVALLNEIPAEKIISAFQNFKGVKRRFEYVYKTDKTIYIDDYAHHPEELSSLIRSAKRLFNNKKCVVAFQPHLYSRTRDFAQGFADSLSMADEAILLDIYPARELPIEGVTAETIKEKMTNKSVTVLNKEGLLEYVKVAPIELFITAGAGDIDKLVPQIKSILEHK